MHGRQGQTVADALAQDLGTRMQARTSAWARTTGACSGTQRAAMRCLARRPPGEARLAQRGGVGGVRVVAQHGTRLAGVRVLGDGAQQRAALHRRVGLRAAAAAA